MAHGPDTEELLRRIANIQNGELVVDELNITSLPDLPSGLQKLYCSRTRLTTLPELPSRLQRLWCSNTITLTTLPDLPSGLQELYCNNTSLTILPDLPSGLQILWCANTNITTLLDIPSSLRVFWCDNTTLIRGETESVETYNQRWRAWREEQAAKRRAKERCAIIKEELVAAAWAPKRVEKWLEVGGFELLESL